MSKLIDKEMNTTTRKIKVKDDLIDGVKFYPPCKLVPYVRFEKGICPYSRCNSCEKCLATESDVWELEMLKYTKLEDIGLC